MYKNCEIHTSSRDYGAKIWILDYDNEETIYLDITNKEMEVLYDIIRRIREYNEYPITKGYLQNKENIIWSDEE